MSDTGHVPNGGLTEPPLAATGVEPAPLGATPPGGEQPVRDPFGADSSQGHHQVYAPVYEQGYDAVPPQSQTPPPGPVRPAYTFLDLPDGLDEEDEDELLMPGPTGSWSEPAQSAAPQPAAPQSAVPSAAEPVAQPAVLQSAVPPSVQPLPVSQPEAFDTAFDTAPAESQGRPVPPSWPTLNPPPETPGAAGTAAPAEAPVQPEAPSPAPVTEQFQPLPTAAPRRPLHAGPPIPDPSLMTGQVPVRSLADRGPSAHGDSPFTVPAPSTPPYGVSSTATAQHPGPEYLDQPVPGGSAPRAAADAVSAPVQAVAQASAQAVAPGTVIEAEPVAVEAPVAPAPPVTPTVPLQMPSPESTLGAAASLAPPAAPALPIPAAEPQAELRPEPPAEPEPQPEPQLELQPELQAPSAPVAEAPAQFAEQVFTVAPVETPAPEEPFAAAPVAQPEPEPFAAAEPEPAAVEPAAVTVIAPEPDPVPVQSAEPVLEPAIPAQAVPQPAPSRISAFMSAPVQHRVAVEELPDEPEPELEAVPEPLPPVESETPVAETVHGAPAFEPEFTSLGTGQLAADPAPESDAATAPAPLPAMEPPVQPAAESAVALPTQPAPEAEVPTGIQAEDPAGAVVEIPAQTEPAAPGYDDDMRDAVHRVMRERRDIRNGFRPDPIPHEVLIRVLEAAHTAPSVGYSQPWDFVVIRSAKTRARMHELAERQREAYAASLPKGRAKQFKELKIEAIVETPVNIVVTADRTRGGRHTLGRHTQPQMAPYSAALAVENLWLAARAEGLGVGWVSFFDEQEMVRELGLPEHLDVVAYLCVGYVNEFPAEPELAQAGWAKKRPLSWVVHEETYGRRALPGEEPHSVLQETLRGIRPLDAKALGEAWDRQKRMTKPAGSLGMLEIISAQLCGLSRKCPPPIPEPACVAVFAGDHGVHAQGVTHWPQEVTAQMVANFLAGGAVVNAFAAQVGAEVCVVDVGVATELPPAIESGRTTGLLPRKVRPGTADMTVEPAMTREEALRAVEVGIETARDLVAAGNKALVTGDMGIANTTAAAALICVFTGEDPSVVTGRGTGIDDETHARKISVIRTALDLHRPDPTDPIGVLAAVGGLEHAALAGFLLGAASLRTPVILDGVAAGAAALVAKAIAPEVLAACVAGHRSAEPGHKAALAKLGLRPLIDLDLRLGEGTGALLALPLVQSAARAMHDVATFDSAGVTEKH